MSEALTKTSSSMVLTPRPEWAVGAFLALYPSLPVTVLAHIYTNTELDDIEKEVAPLA